MGSCVGDGGPDLSVKNQLGEPAMLVEVLLGKEVEIELIDDGDTYTYPILEYEGDHRFLTRSSRGSLLAERCYTFAELEGEDFHIVFDSESVTGIGACR